MDTRGFLVWVSPFRNLRINGYLLLPEAYRSLSRLSSALSAKASALCPFCLTFAFWYPSVGISGLDSHCLIDKINYRCLPILRLYIKDIRVTKVSAQVWEKGCWKLASIRAFYHTCICDAVATEWIEDSWGALTIITQIYMYAVFKVRYWLNLYQSYKRKNLFSSYITGKTSYYNSSSRLIRVSIGLIDYLLAPPCFRQGSLSNACIYVQQTCVCCFLFLIWRPPALPHRLQCSTIGRLRLNRRVRDGNGCFPQAHRHQKFRVIQVSAQVWEKGCWKLASIRTFYQACICDAVATEELCSEVHLRTW